MKKLEKNSNLKKNNNTWVNSLKPWPETWDLENPIENKIQKNHETQSLTNSMLKDENKNKINFKIIA